MDCSTPCFPVHHQLSELTQTWKTCTKTLIIILLLLLKQKIIISMLTKVKWGFKLWIHSTLYSFIHFLYLRNQLSHSHKLTIFKNYHLHHSHTRMGEYSFPLNLMVRSILSCKAGIPEQIHIWEMQEIISLKGENVDINTKSIYIYSWKI